MYSRKTLKKSAKIAVKNHILIYIVSLIISAIFGIAYTSAIDIFTINEDISLWERYNQSEIEEQEDIINDIPTSGGISLYSKLKSIWSELAQGKIDETKNKTQQEIQQTIDKDLAIKENVILGRSQGVFSSIINYISSGQILVSIILMLKNITGSDNAAIVLFILFSFAVLMFVWIFLFNIFSVVYKRIFMEGRIYKEVPIQRFAYIFKSGKWCKASMTMLLKDVYEILWLFTIIGGFIKKYSYFLVPYIVAENPDISPNTAITLSRMMMRGHKWQCFVLSWSFILWEILDFFSYGLVGAIYLNPYKEATFAEYYAYIRNLAKENHIENVELLNDKYLYEIPDEEAIKESYKEEYELVNKPLPEYKKKKGIIGFLNNVFGVTLFYGKEDEVYQEYMSQVLAIKHVNSVVSGRTYPIKLNKICGASKENAVKKRIRDLRYMRHYSVTTLVVMFFVVSFIGWIWEVILHLIEDGRFVNRGVLHGPWLPIYGAGGILILLLLFKFRKNPVLEFITAIILCGIVEYCTSWTLEIMHDGKKWWDYTGYFLNLNGRICAEGLLVFGLGGIAFVYIIAPMLDNILRKISLAILVPLCIVLVIIFMADKIYSEDHPNEGRGITDYASSKETTNGAYKSI